MTRKKTKHGRNIVEDKIQRMYTLWFLDACYTCLASFQLEIPLSRFIETFMWKIDDPAALYSIKKREIGEKNERQLYRDEIRINWKTEWLTQWWLFPKIEWEIDVAYSNQNLRNSPRRHSICSSQPCPNRKQHNVSRKSKLKVRKFWVQISAWP